MGTSAPTADVVQKTPEQLEAEAQAAEAARVAREAHVQQVVAEFAPIMNNRVRISFEGRKMDVPGRLFTSDDIPVGLSTNWGLELDLTKEQYTGIEIKELDSGRFVKYSAPAPASETTETPEASTEAPEPESDEEHSDDDEQATGSGQ